MARKRGEKETEGRNSENENRGEIAESAPLGFYYSILGFVTSVELRDIFPG